MKLDLNRIDRARHLTANHNNIINFCFCFEIAFRQKKKIISGANE